MATDLDLDDDRYAWVLSIFFFGYLICEVPSNMILSRSRPSLFLPAIMLIWGVLSALMSISKTYGALLGFRFVLGCIEAGFFPGVLYYLSCWYTKAELGTRGPIMACESIADILDYRQEIWHFLYGCRALRGIWWHSSRRHHRAFTQRPRHCRLALAVYCGGCCDCRCGHDCSLPAA